MKKAQNGCANVVRDGRSHRRPSHRASGMRNLARGAPGAARPSRHRRHRASLSGAVRAARSTCLRNERWRNFIWRSSHHWRARVPAPARPPAVRRELPGRLIAIASSDSAEFVDPLRDETLPAPDGEVISYRGSGDLFAPARRCAMGISKRCAGFMTAQGMGRVSSEPPVADMVAVGPLSRDRRPRSQGRMWERVEGRRVTQGESFWASMTCGAHGTNWRVPCRRIARETWRRSWPGTTRAPPLAGGLILNPPRKSSHSQSMFHKDNRHREVPIAACSDVCRELSTGLWLAPTGFANTRQLRARIRIHHERWQ